MNVEPTQALAAALDDRQEWIRLGAALAAPKLAPMAAIDLLSGQQDMAQRAAHVAGLAKAGEDVVTDLAAMLWTDRGEIGAIFDRRRSSDSSNAQWHDLLVGKVEAGVIDVRTAGILLPVFAATIRARSQLQAAAEPDDWAGAARQHAAAISRALEQRFASWQLDLAVHRSPALELAMRELRSGNAAAAAGPLVVTALTEANPLLRMAAEATLPRLGLAAAAPLLSILAGREPSELGGAFRAAAAEAGVSSRDVRGGALLAAQALERFDDFETATALTNLYIDSSGSTRALAARSLARMPANAALPSLLWASARHRSERERRDAAMLVEQVIEDKGVFELDYHRVGHRPIEAESLHWVRDLAQTGLGNWAEAPGTAWPILNSAIAVSAVPAGETEPMPAAAVATPESAEASSHSLGRIGRALRSLKLLLPARRSLYPHADLPDSCPPGGEIVLSVWLDPSAAASIGAPVAVPFAGRQEHTRLFVIPVAAGFHISPHYAPIKVSREGKSTVAVFRLRARALGDQVVDIKFLRDTDVIGHCCVVTRVTEIAGDNPARTITLQPVRSSEFEEHPGASLVMIALVGPRGAIEWRGVESGRAPRRLGRSPERFSRQEAAALAESHSRRLREAIEEDLSPEDMRGVLSQISGRGHALLLQIAPPAVRSLVAGLPDDAVLVVESNADWIPWELLADSPEAPVWGERLVMVRTPLVAEPPVNAQSASNPEAGSVGQAVMVVGDDIARANQDPKRTFSTLANRVTSLVGVDWDRLHAGLQGKDVVHFLCHGGGDPLHLRYGRGVPRQLEVDQVPGLRLKPGAVVFANACKSAVGELLLADFRSFGEAFYVAGARPFIGTLAAVPQEEAIEFSALFYKHFAFTGLPAGFALRMAKREARESPRFKVPIWLLYCLYGTGSGARVRLVA